MASARGHCPVRKTLPSSSELQEKRNVEEFHVAGAHLRFRERS
jgi:hypothetical protein